MQNMYESLFYLLVSLMKISFYPLYYLNLQPFHWHAHAPRHHQ